MPYTAGWNVPGYLSESDPETFDTYGEAVQYLTETVDRFWDDDYTAADEEDRERADARWLDVHTRLHNAAPAQDTGDHEDSGTFQEYAGDGRLVFWITPTEES